MKPRQYEAVVNNNNDSDYSQGSLFLVLKHRTEDIYIDI